MPDRALVQHLLDRLKRYLDELEGALAVGCQEYESDYFKYHTGERLLELLVEYAREVAVSLLADQPGQRTLTYANAFEELADARIVPYELAVKLQPLAKRRNIVVHDYEAPEAKPESVYDLLMDNLEGYRQFVAYIQMYTSQLP